jgi:hypothetical protein
MKTNFSMITETKNLQHEVVWNDMARLLTKGNFKRRTMCDDFDKI